MYSFRAPIFSILIRNFCSSKNQPKIALIACIDKKYGLAKNNKIPWKIKEDMHFFKDVNQKNYVKNEKNEKNEKNAIIIGRNTWLTLVNESKDLKKRINIVITSMNKKDLNEDFYTVNSLEEAISLGKKMSVGKIFISGGEEIYKQALNHYLIDEIYLTKINYDYKC